MNSSLHTCSAAICPDPPEIDHGSVNITGNCIGDYAHYTCDPCFNLTGDLYLTCEKLVNYTAAFQPNPPVCHRECCMNWLNASCVRIQKAINTVHWSINLRDEYLWFSTAKTIYPPMLSSLAHVQTASRLWKMLLCVNSLLHICSAAICPDPPEIDHGSVNITGNCICECCMRITDRLHPFLCKAYQNSENYRHSTLMYIYLNKGWMSMLLRWFTTPITLALQQFVLIRQWSIMDQ